MPILGGCLCFDLPTGTKFIGVIYLLAAIINALALAFVNLMLWAMNILPQLLTLLNDSIKEQETHNSKHDDFSGEGSDYPDYTNSSSTNTEQLKEIVNALEYYSYGLMVLCLVLLALAILSIVSSSMLIHGVRKSRRGLLVPWILQEFIHILLALTLAVLMFVLFGAQSMSWTVVVPIILCCFIEVFFIIVVISQYQALGLIRMHDEMCMK